MKIHDVTQGSPEWLALRTKYPTASEFSNIITPKELKPSKSMVKYIARKLAEKWMGQPMESVVAPAADQGTVRQDAARDWYGLEMGVDVQAVGLILADDEKSACSPDGLIGGQYGLEVKCPEADTHVRWVLEGELPPEHMLQVQGSMMVCGLTRWDFLSYYPEMPNLLLTILPEPSVHDELRRGLGEFWKQFDQGWERLIEANGGREPARTYTVEYENGARVEKLAPKISPESADFVAQQAVDWEEFVKGGNLPMDARSEGLRAAAREGNANV